jgi:(S)-sulfolactate dehydrogenase
MSTDVNVPREVTLPAAAGGILQGMPNLRLTPHIAGVTGESKVRVSAVAAHAVVEVLAAS